MNREQKIAVLAAAADACPNPERKAKYLAQKHVLILAATREEREREDMEQRLRNWEKRKENFWKLKEKNRELYDNIQKNSDELIRKIRSMDEKTANNKQESYKEYIKKLDTLSDELNKAYEDNDMEKAKSISKKFQKMNASFKGSKKARHEQKRGTQE
ncbi:MAG: hypothetical protein Q4C88_08615 [Akkermansia sp.]|nr:hypothetical protein [Akkermansia sp.]